MSHAKVVIAHAALLFPTITFAAWNVLAETVPTAGMNILILCAVKDATASAALATFWLGASISRCFRKQHISYGLPTGWKDWCLLAVVGLSAPFFASLATVLCSAWAGGDTVGILNALAPACSSSLAIVTGFERSSWYLGVGILLASSSGIIAIWGSASHSATSTLGPHVFAGTLIGLAMAFAQACFFVALKPLFRDNSFRKAIPSNVVVTIAFAIATSISLLSCTVFIIRLGVEQAFSTWSTSDTLKGCYAGLICGALNYALVMWACQILPVSLCSIYGALQPPITAIIAFGAFGEALTTMGYTAMALAVVSVVMVSWERSGSETRLQHWEDSRFQAQQWQDRLAEGS